MKYIDADKLINSNYLVKTPINKLNNKIINSEDKNILLIGKSGSGKTVTLKYMEKLSMNKNYKVIYTRFESIINLAKKEPNELYSKVNLKILKKKFTNMQMKWIIIEII